MDCKNVLVVAGVPGMEFFSHSMGLSPSLSAPSTDCSDQAENKITYNLSIFQHETAPPWESSHRAPINSKIGHSLNQIFAYCINIYIASWVCAGARCAAVRWVRWFEWARKNCNFYPDLDTAAVSQQSALGTVTVSIRWAIIDKKKLLGSSSCFFSLFSNNTVKHFQAEKLGWV